MDLTIPGCLLAWQQIRSCHLMPAVFGYSPGFFNHLMSESQAIPPLSGPYKALKGLIRPLKSLIRPWRALQGPEGLNCLFKVFYKPFQGLAKAFKKAN